MQDWFLLVITCSTGLISALLFFIHSCAEANRHEKLKEKFDGELSEELSNIVDSVAEFQKVAHDFPNSSDDCETGQLVMVADELFIKTDDSYVKIASESTHSHLPTNCVNCGAPLHGHRCQFCDTEYN